MRNLILMLLVFQMALTLTAQDQVITLEAFYELEAATGVDITLYKGEPKAEVTMIKGDIDDLVITSKNGVAKIQFKSQNWGWNGGSRQAKVKLYTNELQSVEASAGAKIYSDEVYRAKRFSSEVSSGASLSLEVEAEDMTIEVSSGGSIAMEGSVGELEIEVSSGGSFSGKKLAAGKVNAEASSGGSAKVWAKDSIVAEATSGGSVKYKGEPTHVDIDVSKYSGGSIKKI